MTNRINQIYEPYWQYTAAKTDLNGKDFIDVMRACITYFDENFKNLSYEDLQLRISAVMGITMPSTRKMLNQLVKLGFLRPGMGGYRQEALEYVAAKTDRKRENILSKTVYHFSNFNNSMEKPDFGGQGQINFFLKTLEEVGCVSDKELTALMFININDYPAGFLTKDELQNIYYNAEEQGFIERKYNQISHLKNLLGRLDDLKLHDGALYFKTDAERLFGNEAEGARIGRDSYLQRVYKSELEEESTIHFETNIPKCMIEGLAYPVLIASHIKPYQFSDEKEAFDVNNGLLLSKNFDSLFDLGYITFENDGTIIPSSVLSKDVIEYTTSYRLNEDFINPKRMKYMKYHRENVFEKRYSLPYVRRYNQI